MSNFVLKLEGVVSPYNGEHYVGFVLDVLREYLGWNVNNYILNGNTLYDENATISMRLKDSRISVRRIEKDTYLISGFPESENKEDLQRRAPEILKRILGSK